MTIAEMPTSSFHSVFPHFTFSNSVFHSFRGLMNSIKWPALGVWVFIAQLVEHCSANAEATGTNPVESPKKTFFQATSQLLKLRFNCDGHIFISKKIWLEKSGVREVKDRNTVKRRETMFFVPATGRNGFEGSRVPL